MNILDVNVLVALYRPSHPHHVAATDWFDESLRSGEPFTVPDLVWVAFVRLMTNRRVVPAAATFDESWAFARAVQQQGTYATYQAHPRTLVEFARLCSETRALANLVTDAYLAAIATSFGGTVVTFDRDFRKFDDVRVTELA
jgi:toxin-antitoxin system PIN domain toxin